MKKFFLVVIALAFSLVSFAQLSGSYSIPSATYPTIESAIADLNLLGVGPGGVTFNVAAGHTETLTGATGGVITTLTSSVSQPIIFQKSGAGANPIITAGVGSGTMDGIIVLAGADYVTFDGIDLLDPVTNTTPVQMMEYGYALLKNSGTDGTQNTTIKNCVITLQRINTNNTYGIYSNNHTTAATTQLTVTALSGTNSNNKFYTNTVQNVNTGIYVSGFADVTPYTYFDQTNDIGGPSAPTGNIIRNYGGNTGMTSYGIYVYAQNLSNIANNNVNNTAGGGVNAATSLYGIYQSFCNNSTGAINSNTLQLSIGTSGTLYGIYASLSGTGTLDCNGNIFQGFNMATGSSSTGYFIYIGGYPAVSNFNNNQFINNTTLGTTGSIYFIYNSASTPTINITGNTYNNNIKTGAGGTVYGYYNFGSPSGGTETFSGNTITNLTLTGATAFYGTYSGTSASQNKAYFNNTITNIQGGSSSMYMMYNTYGLTNNTYSNTIHDITNGNGGTGAGIVYTYYLGNTSTVTLNAYSNTAYNITNANSGTTYGIYATAGTTNNVYLNKIYSISGTNAAAVVNGIYLAGGPTTNVYNNFVYDLKTPASTSINAISGIYSNAGTNVGIYYNTVFLNATSSSVTTFGTNGIYISTSPNTDIRNNIVVNTSTPVGTAYTAAYRRSSTTITTYALASNNNLFYAGTPGASKVIYTDGTNFDQTLSAFKARVSPRDASSVTENPPFVSAVTPIDVHLQAAVPTQCESGGATVAAPIAITADIDGQNRYPNAGYPVGGFPPVAPDMGADEFGGLNLDLTPPNISFTPLGNTSVLTARTLTTAITDGSGVPQAGIGLPVLYWKKFAAGTWQSATGAFVSGSTYTFTFGAGVVTNDSIYYYIVAQDMATTPNVGSNPPNASGFTINPPAAGTPPPNASLYAYKIIGAICGTFNVGAGGDYPTLTAAVADLNSKEITCPVVFQLTDAMYTTPAETFPIVIEPNNGSSAVNTVTIKPAPGVTPTVGGSNTLGILLIDGADYIIIDGSNSGGTDRSLTLRNTLTSPAAINTVFGMWFNGTGAQNNTIKNCKLYNGTNSSTYTYGIFLNYAGGFFNNTTIQNNEIYKAYYGMQFVGVNGGVTSGGTVTQNIFGSPTDSISIGNTGLVLTYLDGTTFSRNTIQNLKVGTNPKGFNVSTSTMNTTITRNNITGIVYTGTGGYGGKGMDINTGSATSNLTITSNTLSNIKGDGWSSFSSDAIVGIRILGTTGGLNIWHNSINLEGTISRSSATTDASAAIYFVSTATNINLRDNIFKNSLENTTGVATAYAIVSDAPNTAFTAINYNDYFASGPEGVLGFLGGQRTTLAAWQTATAQDANSQNTDPLFASATDLHPSAAALAIAGIFIPSVSVDIAGNGRSDPPDIGAYQFSAGPTVVTTAATGITTSAGTLNGTINANNTFVVTGFEWGITTAYGNTIAATPATVSGSVVTPITATITGLQACVVYHYRAIGTTGGLTATGNDMTFTTLAIVPSPVTDAASGITATDATLNGNVNANGVSTDVTFEYGTTTAYGTTVPGVPANVNTTSPVPVTAAITGLLPNTLYHYRVNGTTACGVTNGNDMTFTTLAAPPVAVTDPATMISSNSAQLNGTVNPNNSLTTVSFDWGLTAAYGSNIAATPSPINGSTNQAVSASLGGLLENTTYHYRVVATNVAGTTFGDDVTFYTQCPGPPAAGPITGPNSVCKGGSGYIYTVDPIPGATSYVWTVPAGGNIDLGAGSTSISVSFSLGASSGNVTVAGSNTCGIGTSSSLPVTVNDIPSPTVSGPSSSCTGANAVYSTQAGFSNYAWTVSPGGSIISGAGTQTITVLWNTAGAQTVSVNYENAFGCGAPSPVDYPVTVNLSPVPTLTGPTDICVNSGYYFYVTDAGFTNYTWAVSPGGVITGGASTNQVQIQWIAAGAQWVSVNYTNAAGCVAPEPTVYDVNVTDVPGPAGTITGTDIICGGGTGNYTVDPIANAATYVWTLPAGATITAGDGTNSITVSFAPDASSGDVTVYANNLCGNGTTSPPFPITVTSIPDAAGPITGQAAVCDGDMGIAYSVAAITNATGYVWTLPAGATIATGENTNSITVDFAPGTPSGVITVVGTNTCGTGVVSPDFNVTVNPVPAAPVITLTGYILSSSSSDGNQWYKDGVLLTGATGQTHDASVTGSGWYWDVVTLAGCASDTSNNIYVLVTGTENLPGSSFTIYPVPNDGLFTVSIQNKTATTYQLEIYNVLGIQVYADRNLEVSQSQNKVIDLRSASNGVYTVVLKNGDSQVIRKITIRK